MGSDSPWLVCVIAKQRGYVWLLPLLLAVLSGVRPRAWLEGEGRNPFPTPPPPSSSCQSVLNQLLTAGLPGGKAQEQQLLLNEVG